MSQLTISVTRSGGIAGLSTTWRVRVDRQPDADEWATLVRQLPWNERSREPASADRFVYRIQVSRRRIVLPEQRLDGAWRELVDRVRDASAHDTPLVNRPTRRTDL